MLLQGSGFPEYGSRTPSVWVNGTLQRLHVDLGPEKEFRLTVTLRSSRGRESRRTCLKSPLRGKDPATLAASAHAQATSMHFGHCDHLIYAVL